MMERSIDKRIRIRQHLDANPSTVQGDPSQLQNALLNLGLNARDAMTEGGDLVFSTDVRTLDEAYCRTIPYEVVPGRYLQVRVTDNGVGMSREVQSHLFEPFFTTKEMGKGTGMGLAAVYGTVKNHRGFIEVTSELDRGTTIELAIPLHESVAVSEDREVGPAEVQRRTGRILVVDDELMIRDLAAEMLRSLGHHVTTCQDGSEALAYYTEHWREIDLVILDMVMPGRSGRDTFLDMRRLNPAIKALLSSGFSVDGEAQRILDEGVLGFLQKPYTMRELTIKVGQLLK
jgi:CheY-like chemotaxis protein